MTLGYRFLMLKSACSSKGQIKPLPPYTGRHLFLWDLVETLCPVISDPDRIENASFVKRLWLTGVRVCVWGAQGCGWGAQCGCIEEETFISQKRGKKTKSLVIQGLSCCLFLFCHRQSGLLASNSQFSINPQQRTAITKE